MSSLYFTYTLTFIVIGLFILADLHQRLSSPAGFTIDLTLYFIATVISISIFVFRKSLNSKTLKLLFNSGIIIGLLIFLSNLLINQASDAIKEIFKILNQFSIIISLPTLTGFFIYYSRNHKPKLQQTNKKASSRSKIYKVILATFIMVSTVYLIYILSALYIKTH